jgi:deazaflavin-dependent oxidoreductase (nitroreductase family)
MDIGNEERYVPSPWEWVSEQVDLFERSKGAEGNLNEYGLPIIVVTTIGAKTGAIRKTPVMRVEHEGQYALVASLGGAPEHPKWYFNLRANPSNVLIQDGPVRFRVTVREADGAERALWWERAVWAFPPYAEYQASTDRRIPLLVTTSAPLANEHIRS